MSRSGHSADIVRPAADRRVSRTRRSIDDAFLRLLKHHGYDDVGVSDIVREADVGRATFYEHYTSKDDLLRAQLQRVVDAMLIGGTRPAVIDATRLFAHIRAVPVLYRLVGGRASSTRSVRVLGRVLEARVAALLEAPDLVGVPMPPPWTAALAARVVVANLSALLLWWVDDGMAASDEAMQALFVQCTAPVLSASGGGVSLDG